MHSGGRPLAIQVVSVAAVSPSILAPKEQRDIAATMSETVAHFERSRSSRGCRSNGFTIAIPLRLERDLARPPQCFPKECFPKSSRKHSSRPPRESYQPPVSRGLQRQA